MMTEISERTAVCGAPPVVFYDDACPVCLAAVARLRPILGRRGFVFEPLPADEPKTEMKLRQADGAWLGGADALVAMARAVWWAKPLAWLAAIPGVMPPLRRAYRAFARRRHCADGACGWTPRPGNIFSN